MIKSIKAVNFQSHSVSTLKLAKGLTTLVGRSDSGKSALIRLIKLIIENRPTGDRYRKHGSTITSGTIKTDVHKVSRVKTDSVNKYIVDGEDYKAIRTDIPEEVHTALNLTEVNVQSQIEQYFLLDKTPGQVARALNKTAGLHDMDLAMAEIKRMVSDTTKDIKQNKKDKELTELQLQESSWVGKADKHLRKIEKVDEKITELGYELDDLIGILSNLEEVQSVILNLPVQECTRGLKKLEALSRDINTLSDTHMALDDIILALEKAHEDLPIVIPDIQAEEALAYAIGNLLAEKAFLDGIISNLDTLHEQVEILDNTIQHEESVLAKLWDSYDVCPTCERKLP